ncbi:M14 metallopeptidase family protein [Gramella sp. MAR_2010_147]|uniref:M14 family metallopeptidase n=1 Tax=Gramella sp. MAR_2010_147 TaxID=1250205 RepID=UPI00087AEFAF|nr:M14 metallopeptidase family protein [Gramella sp. MAR_2010_147]SDS59547.1 Zinc carboxypeptidase [Gramella sp. MAR_2010_147]
MKRIFIQVLAVLVISNISIAQNDEFSEELFEGYSEFKEKEITKRRIKHKDVISLLEKLMSDEDIKFQKVGESIKGRSLNLISLGTGKTDVFLWSQMHGDESTATMAIFDILNFFKSDEFEDEKRIMLKELKIHFLPMLNPDGAEKFTRRNALGIDVNRDALRLQSPEAKTLKRIRDSLDADFGFNLHDQSKYYNAERTEKPATISFLAPAYNYEKEINEVRGNAMKIIVGMNKVLQKYAPGQVGRYNDDFEPRAFGDNIQKWGTSTILIESGGYPNDPEKQEIRKLNFVSILAALNAIATESYKNEEISEYENIPNNDRMLFDLKLTGLHYEMDGEDFVLDIGINRSETDLEGNSDFYYSGRIADQGDLSTSYGYEEVDASGLKLEMGEIYPETINSKRELDDLDPVNLLKEGYAYLHVSSEMMDKKHSNYPLNMVSEDFTLEKDLQPGTGANFFLYKDGEVKYAIINGFLSNLEEPHEDIKNTIIYN